MGYECFPATTRTMYGYQSPDYSRFCHLYPYRTSTHAGTMRSAYSRTFRRIKVYSYSYSYWYLTMTNYTYSYSYDHTRAQTRTRTRIIKTTVK
eukprot:scaffold266400_cov27-Prasinocladus_malaysianus.AAC.1